jgi:hypothetical protein
MRRLPFSSPWISFPSLLCLFFLMVFTGMGCRVKRQILVVNKVEEIIESRQGNNITLRPGKFLIRNTFEVPNGAKVMGSGTTLLFDNQTVFPVMRVSKVQDIRISGVKFLAVEPLRNDLTDAELMSTHYQYMIDLTDSKGIQVQDCHFDGCYGTSIKTHDCQNILIKNCEFKNSGTGSRKEVPYGYDAIFLGGYRNTENVLIKDCRFENLGMTFPKGNPPWPNDSDGIQIQGVGKVKDVKIKNCTFLNCSSRGVKIQSGEKIEITHCSFEGGYSAVLIPMASEVNDVTITNNKIKRTLITFGSDAFEGPKYVSKLLIEGNEVDSCNHFFRTSGHSNIRDGVFRNNKVINVGTFFISGRFENTIISENEVGGYGTLNDQNFQMCFLLSPESVNVTIERNRIRAIGKNAFPLDNRSKQKVLVRENSFE